MKYEMIMPTESVGKPETKTTIYQMELRLQ